MRRHIRFRTLAPIIFVSISLAAPASARQDGAAPVREGFGIARILADPDFEPGSAESSAALLEQRYRWAYPRSGVDRPDEVSGRQLHPVYVVPSDFPDEQLDVNGVIEDSIRSSNAWIRAQTGDKEWRLDTYTFEWDDPDTEEFDPIEVPAVDVTFIKSTRPGSALDSIGEVDSELVAHGLNLSDKRYVAYVASNAGGVCGSAWAAISPFGAAEGQYSAIYLNSSAGCRAKQFAPDAQTPSYTESIVVQEVLHNDGQVTLIAPQNCAASGSLGHVCTGVLWVSQSLDPLATDVLFPFVGLPLSQKVLDENHLNYFRHPGPWRDLDSSPLFRSI